jgi:tryptophan 2,3-dioxygenase
VAEVVAFGLSKSLLQTEKYRSEAQASLEQIARQGTLVPVEAVRLLAASAATPEEKKLAHDVGEDVKKRYPSVTQYLSGVGEGVATP